VAVCTYEFRQNWIGRIAGLAASKDFPALQFLKPRSPLTEFTAALPLTINLRRRTWLHTEQTTGD